jgi:hypothetical protein
MATRPHKDLQYAIIRTYTVTAGQTVAVGQPIKFASSDTEVQEAGAGEVAFGICTAIGGNTAVTAGAAGDKIEAALLGNAIVPAVVGTGGSTRGVLQQAVSDGVTDSTPNGAPTTGVLVGIIGLALQSGVAGDQIGLLVPAPGYVLEE